MYSVLWIHLFFALSLSGQGRCDTCLSARSDAYMDRQQGVLLEEVFGVADVWPPAWPEPRIRQTALYLFDAVMHDRVVACRPAVQRVFHERISKAVAEMERTEVEEGAVIWKLYNMGYVVRTPSVTVAFDVVRGTTAGAAFALSDTLIRRLARQCDVLFVSHKHRDHQDPVVARIFLKAGRPVVAPDQFWRDDPLFRKVTHLPRQAGRVQLLPLPARGDTLQVVIYPGHQMASIDVNVVLVITREGLRIAHLGDQVNDGDFMPDFAWIDHVKERFPVDIMITTVWASHLPRIAEGFSPELTLLGHEDELGHPVDDRDPWWGDTAWSEPSLRAFYRSSFPYLRMLWGESYHYLPRTKK